MAMEEEALQKIHKMKERVGTWNFKVADSVFNYFMDNEFNVNLMLESELNEKEECYLLEVLKLKHKLRSYELDWVYNACYEIVYGHKPGQQSEEEEAKQQSVDQSNSNNADGSNKFNDYFCNDSCRPDVIVYDATDSEKWHCRTYLNQQFPRLSQFFYGGGWGDGVLFFLTLGKRYKIDLFSLLIDIYNEERLRLYISSNKQQYLEFEEFVDKKSPYLRKLRQHVRELLVDGVKDYFRKFQMYMLFMSFKSIDDSYLAYVQYACALSAAISKLQSVFVNGSGCPLQIDFWVIPNHVVEIKKDASFEYMPIDNNDMDDEWDDNDRDVLNAPNSDDQDEQIGRIEQRLDSANIVYVKEVLDRSTSTQNAVARKMLNGLKFICRNKYAHRRVIILIDRRNSTSKLNHNSDVMYIYQPHQAMYSQILPNFCHETLQNLSTSYLLPKLVHEERLTHISCRDFLMGRMWTLSFHIYHWNKIRVYHHSQFNASIRFRPKHFYQLWPIFFYHRSSNNAAHFASNTVNKQYVQQNWKLPLKDQLFDTWYPVVSGAKLQHY